MPILLYPWKGELPQLVTNQVYLRKYMVACYLMLTESATLDFQKETL